MSEETPHENPPSDQPDHAQPSAFGEKELDELLARTADLASNVSRELSGEEAPPAKGPVLDPTLPTGGFSGAVDAQLSEMQSLIESTSEEIGARSYLVPADLKGPAAKTHEMPDFMQEFMDSEEPSASTAKHKPGAGESSHHSEAGYDEADVTRAQDPESPVPDKSYSVPDFMDEFTRPESTGSQRTSGPPHCGETPMGQSETSGRSAAERKPQAQGRPAAQTSTAGLAAHEEGRECLEVATRSEMNETRQTQGRMVGRVSPTVAALADRAARLLETIDKPVRNVGIAARRWIGWIAITLLGASLALFLLSFL